VAAIVVAVVAFLVIQGGDDSSDDGDKAAQTTPAQTTPGETTPTASVPPPVTTIRIEDGKPVGGVAEIELDKGDMLRFRVKSDEAHEIHLHGYDVEKEVEAGGQVSYNLKADIDGIFEAEVEDLKEQIAEIRVNP
jgi:N-acetylmuramoyl-L-alanine amidase CwlA